jgi:hypothetical protein
MSIPDYGHSKLKVHLFSLAQKGDIQGRTLENFKPTALGRISNLIRKCITYPATLDSSLHLGVSLPILPFGSTRKCMESSDDSLKNIMVRVPSTLAAYWRHFKDKKSSQVWACAGNMSLLLDDAAECSYWLINFSNGEVNGEIIDLIAKPMRTRHEETDKVIPYSATIAKMQYALESKIIDALKLPTGQFSCQDKKQRRKGTEFYLSWHHHIVQVSSKLEMLYLYTRNNNPFIAMLAGSRSLEYLQEILKLRQQQIGLGLVAVTASSFEKRSPYNAFASATTKALVKTASQEYTSIQWQVLESSSHSRYGLAEAIRITEGRDYDPYGLTLSNGTTSRPQMLRAIPRIQTQPPLIEFGDLLVTGGLGDIGKVAALWGINARSTIRHTHLLGRSGRTNLHIGLHLLTSYITISRCDVASKEEACNATKTTHSSLHCSSYQVWHAAGLVQDATLTRQSPKMLRSTIAPKVHGIINLTGNTFYLPISQSLLFSSTAALFGPAGQGNYAVANAQLNAWAEHSTATGLLQNSYWFLVMEDDVNVGLVQQVSCYKPSFFVMYNCMDI